MTKDKILKNSESVSQLLLALANEKRVQIICHLLNGEESVGALAEKVGLSQSALSQHLSKLRAQELVITRRHGQVIYYSLKDERIRKLFKNLGTSYFSEAG